MNRDELRARQAPLKDRYRTDPASAKVVLRAAGTLGPDVTCRVEAGGAIIEAGLHPATGGTGLAACSGEMLLQALVGCAGVTLNAVATAMGIALRGGRIEAEGDFDVRGTLGVSRDAPVGFSEIRLNVSLDTDASEAERAKLLELTERYCVVYQTLARTPAMRVTRS